MTFVYTTDLHGDEGKYNKALDLCVKSGASLLHLGADLLPKGYSIQPRQKDFLKKFLSRFVEECSGKNIKVLGMMGNDDIWSRRDLCSKALGNLLDRIVHQHQGMLFAGYPYVPDYPFSFKWACKLDNGRSKPEPLMVVRKKDVAEGSDGKPVEVKSRCIPVECSEEGFVAIGDLDAYFKAKGTIADDMKAFKSEPNLIVAFHTPPKRCGLDLCTDGRKVGSASIRDWIRKHQPYMVLCGHLHESPWVSGKWCAKIGKTLVIQPGQFLSAATIDPSSAMSVNDDILVKKPYLDTSLLRAVVVEASPGTPPVVELITV